MGQSNPSPRQTYRQELSGLTVADSSGTLCASCDLSLKEYTRLITRVHRTTSNDKWRIDSTYCLECGPDTLEYPTDADELLLTGNLGEAKAGELELRDIELLDSSFG